MLSKFARNAFNSCGNFTKAAISTANSSTQSQTHTYNPHITINRSYVAKTTTEGHTIQYNVQEPSDLTYYPSTKSANNNLNHNSNLQNINFSRKRYDVIIIGSGHNGLVAACYLAKYGNLKVLVLERRDMIGGACITEEVFPGYKFSRASYLAGLLRQSVIDELNLKNYPKNNKLTFLKRNPSSFTPTRINDPLYKGKYLMFYNGDETQHKKTLASIAQFSEKDVINFDKFEDYLGEIRSLLEPILDYGPPIPDPMFFLNNLHFDQYRELWKSTFKDKRSTNDAKRVLLNLYEIMTSPASKILDRYFESDILKTTLATDAIIGTTMSPNDIGTAYVLLHHVMGQIDGTEGVWAYTQGGMGNITQALKECAIEHGVEIVTNANVKQISTRKTAGFGNGKKSSGDENPFECNGVILDDNTLIEADTAVLSNVTPHHLFVDLFNNTNSNSNSNNSGDNPLPDDFLSQIEHTDYQCGAFKINCVVNQLPNFECIPNERDINGQFIVGDQHKGTTHFESRMKELEEAALEAKQGIPANRPIIEMTIPSSLDKTLITNQDGIKNGHHIVQFFVQYAPYDLNSNHLGIKSWDDANGEFKLMFAERVFNIVDEFIPNFKSSVLYADVLSPRDLEKVFGLYKGNIYHGALSLDQVGYARPAKGYSNYQTPVNKLYLCGAGAHPGGGVMGAPGRNCAKTLLNALKINVKLK